MFPCNPRYIEVYISTKREMQRHLSLRKEMIRLRRELGSTAEERELDYTRGSSAEREKGESSPMVCVCVFFEVPSFYHCCLLLGTRPCCLQLSRKGSDDCRC